MTIVASYAPWQATLTSCGAAVIIFLAAGAVGYLQGIERFNLIFLLRVGEVLVKVAVGLTLVRLGMGAWGAVSGFAFGALLVFLSAIYYMRSDAIEHVGGPGVRFGFVERSLIEGYGPRLAE